jgi:hypothetical protein
MIAKIVRNPKTKKRPALMISLRRMFFAAVVVQSVY